MKRSVSGYQGFWIAITGCVCLVFWWVLFTIWFCGKKAGNPEFNGGDAGGNTELSDITNGQRQPLADGSDDDEDEA